MIAKQADQVLCHCDGFANCPNDDLDCLLCMECHQFRAATCETCDGLAGERHCTGISSEFNLPLEERTLYSSCPDCILAIANGEEVA